MDGHRAGGLAAITSYTVPLRDRGLPAPWGEVSRIQPQEKPRSYPALTFGKRLWGAPGVGWGCVSMRPHAGDE